MDKEILLGIDIGTSSCKVAAFLSDGTVLDQEAASYDVYYPQAGWAEQDPEEWWAAVCGALQQLFKRGKVRAEQIAGIGVDGQSWSAIPINAEGQVLGRTPIWMDTRAAEICTELNQRLGQETIFKVAGNPLEPTYTLPKVLWLQKHRPELFAQTAQILQSNSFIVYRLTEALSQDLSQSYGWQCFNLRTRQFDEALCQAMGLDSGLFPPVVASHTVVGHVTEKAAAISGLVPGIPVVAGGLDAACGALGAGVIEAGQTQEQGGQAGGMSICLDEYKADPRLILGCHVVPDRWLLQGGTVGGAGVAKWLLAQVCGEEARQATAKATNPFYEMDVLAQAVPAGSEGLVFLPYMAGERSPIWDRKAKGVYYGLDFSKTRGHLIRAAQEGVAFSLQHNLEIAQEIGATVTELHAVGGAANSLLWTQIKADVTGKPLVVPASDTATTLGAAILAGVGVGVFASFAEGVARTVTVNRQHDPNLAHAAIYQTNYQLYRDLYQNLKETMARY